MTSKNQIEISGGLLNGSGSLFCSPVKPLYSTGGLFLTKPVSLGMSRKTLERGRIETKRGIGGLPKCVKGSLCWKIKHRLSRIYNGALEIARKNIFVEIVRGSLIGAIGIWIGLWVLMFSGCGASIAKAEEAGASFYAIQSKYWSCKDTIGWFDGQKDEKKLAILWRTFGDETDCISQFFALPGNKFFEVHPFNEASRASRHATKWELAPKLSTKAFKSAIARKDPAVLGELSARVAEITETFREECSKPEVTCAMSTGLEHRFNEVENEIVSQTIRSQWPWAIVDNPVGGNKERSKTADYIELHGVQPSFPKDRACIANLDGVDVKLPISGRGYGGTGSHINASAYRGYLKRYASCRAVFAWIHEFNCKPSGSQWITQRSRRNCVRAHQIVHLKQLER